jgi:CDP-diacylglycerol---glycerol-3-phosphate 3-phosphatidyltransferase
MIANLVSLLRTLLALVVVALLFTPLQGVYLVCFVLTVLVIAMDALDGFLARKLNQASTLGAVIDILGDRIVEQVYWVTFLALGWVPLVVPLVVIVRGIVVDGLRAIALEQGYTAFGKKTLQQSGLAKLIVSSNFSRTSYAVVKAVAFSLLILGHTPALPKLLTTVALWTGNICTVLATFFCIARGLPVVIEGARFFSSPSLSGQEPPFKTGA